MTKGTKRTLRARDIERLENTSIASILGGGVVDTPINLPVDGTYDCSYSCATECSCACQSNICCVTNDCTTVIDPSAGGCSDTCEPTVAGCRTGVYPEVIIFEK